MEGYYLLFDVLPWTCQKFPRKLYCSEVHGSKVHRNVHRRFHRSFRGSFRGCPWKLLPRNLPLLPWKWVPSKASTEASMEVPSTETSVQISNDTSMEASIGNFRGRLHGDGGFRASMETSTGLWKVPSLPSTSEKSNSAPDPASFLLVPQVQQY